MDSIGGKENMLRAFIDAFSSVDYAVIGNFCQRGFG